MKDNKIKKEKKWEMKSFLFLSMCRAVVHIYGTEKIWGNLRGRTENNSFRYF